MMFHTEKCPARTDNDNQKKHLRTGAKSDARTRRRGLTALTAADRNDAPTKRDDNDGGLWFAAPYMPRLTPAPPGRNGAEERVKETYSGNKEKYIDNELIGLKYQKNGTDGRLGRRDAVRAARLVL